MSDDTIVASVDWAGVALTDLANQPDNETIPLGPI